MESDFAESVRTTSARPEVRTAVHELYVSLQKQIDIRRPICQSSGRCCRFEEFGHRLYVTTAEMAAFQYDVAESLRSAAISGSQQLPVLTTRDSLSPGYSLQQARSSGCSYQIDGLCSVHAMRPFGCRIFFCDASSTQWQQEQYEIFHGRLKEIHRQYEIPYFYVEWRAALAAMSR